MLRRSEARGACARGTIGRVFAVLATLWAAFGLPGAAQAAGKHAALVVDANSGRVLYAQAADEPRFPASLTKMMTLYIVFELMQQGRLEPSTRMKISGVAAGTAPSKLGLDEGDEIALIDAIKAIITKSANDVAVAVAEHIAGTEEKFARLMTQKARSLGMNATVFKNAHGLPHPEQITTARDMVTLALRLNDDFPRYYAPVRHAHLQLRRRDLPQPQHSARPVRRAPTASRPAIRRPPVSISSPPCAGTASTSSAPSSAASTAGSRNATMRTLLTRALAQASTQKTRTPLLIAKAAPAPERARRSPPQLAEASASRCGPRPRRGPHVQRATAFALSFRPTATKPASNGCPRAPGSTSRAYARCSLRPAHARLSPRWWSPLRLRPPARAPAPPRSPSHVLPPMPAPHCRLAVRLPLAWKLRQTASRAASRLSTLAALRSTTGPRS